MEPNLHKSHQTRLIPGTFGLLVLILMLVATGCASGVTIDAPVVTSGLISPADYVSQFEVTGDHLLIDVRTAEEFASGHIEGAVNIPVEEIAGRLDEIPIDVPVVVYCRSGNRSATASGILTEAGYSQVNDLGGIQEWTTQGLPVVQ